MSKTIKNKIFAIRSHRGTTLPGFFPATNNAAYPIKLNGRTIIPMTNPIIISVESSSWFSIHLKNNPRKLSRKANPHIKASLDKNNSQRINEFRVK